MKQFFSKCPICGNQTTVTSYRCQSCGTEIKGNFEPNEFNNLSKEDLEFLRTYLRNRGNLTKVAERFRISYPTAHSYFNRVLAKLGYIRSEHFPYAEILEKLEKNEIDFSTALSLIKEEKEVKP